MDCGAQSTWHSKSGQFTLRLLVSSFYVLSS